MCETMGTMLRNMQNDGYLAKSIGGRFEINKINLQLGTKV